MPIFVQAHLKTKNRDTRRLRKTNKISSLVNILFYKVIKHITTWIYYIYIK